MKQRFGGASADEWRWRAARPQPIWAARHRAAAHALLLVAVPDPLGPAFPPQALGFAPLPEALPGRRVLMVTSRDDPYAPGEHSATLATRWQAEHVYLGARGHLNAQSSLGDWPQAWAWVEAWRAEG